MRHYEICIIVHPDQSELQCLELPARVVLKGYISPRSRRTQRLLVYITDFN